MKICPLCDKEYSDEACDCSECGIKLIDKKKSRIVDTAGDIIEAVAECAIVDTAGDIIEAVIECVIDSIE